MHSLIRYFDMLSFEITKIYDVKYASTVGAATTHLLKDDSVKDLIVQNINEIELDKFDTMILGHTNELLTLINDFSFTENLITMLLKNGKKIYSFDDYSYFVDNENLYTPKVDPVHIPPSHLGMLYRISKPIIGVFGTSSVQGKFTLQLKLRELFLSHGYSVGQIGTEPSSLLFGMDYVFPMGYNSSVNISDYDSIRYLNYITNELSRKNCDIIIAGSQSGSVIYDLGNINQLNIAQYSFLCGVQPDIIILCVNIFDDIDYIRRSINFLESSIDSHVIALVVYPMGCANNWSGCIGAKKRISAEDYELIKDRLVNEFHKEVYLLGDDNQMKQLAELIIDYFAE